MSGATSEPGTHEMDSSITARLSLLRRPGSKGGKVKTSLLWISNLPRKYSRSLKWKRRPLNYRPAPVYEMKTRVLPAAAGLLLGDSGAAPAEAGGMEARLARGRPTRPQVPSPVGLCSPKTLPGAGGNGEFGEILATEGSDWPEGCWRSACRDRHALVVMLKPMGAWNFCREQIEANCKAINSSAVVWLKG